MRQLASSIFDCLVGVAFVLGIPAALISPRPGVIAVAVTATVLLAGRLVIERRTQGRRALEQH